MEVYKGEVLSEGIALGKVHIEKSGLARWIKKLSGNQDKKDLEQAIFDSIKQIEEIKKNNSENKDYLDIQTLLISDPVLKEKAFSLIEEGKSVSQSINQVLDEYAQSLTASTNQYLQERAIDILDIKNRILSNLNGGTRLTDDEQFIYYAKQLHPSFLIQNKKKILGIVTNSGGYSSHTAILCRQLNIPYLVGKIKSKEKDIIVIDTRKQQIIVNPELESLNHYEEIIKKLSKESFKAVPHKSVGFYANVSDNSELDKVMEYAFDGVGLYRTEMIFMNTNRPYTYEEQYEIYSEAVDKLAGKPIYFRTFDIGDDKQLSYVKSYKKGIDNYKNNPELFKTQIKALINANKFDNLGIMFPMIFNNQEFNYLRDLVLEIKKELGNTSKIKLGMMLETSEAIEKLNEFENVDFISIGTNDLVLSIYHINRNLQKEQLQKYIDDLVLKIAKVVEICDSKKINLSICGELAAITNALKRFIEIGVKNFSVAAPAIKVLNTVYKEFTSK